MGKFSIGTIVFFIALFIFGSIGWVRNIVKLTKTDFEAPYRAEVIRGVGIIPPVGAIVGWIRIED